jgi:uncharacterized protein with HEPN domain
LETSESISSYIRGVSLKDFTENRMIYDAVVRNLQVMAESTQKISQAVKDKNKEVPWRRLVGFRNILVHDYIEGINPEVVWETIVNKLPELYVIFSKIKQELESCTEDNL